MLICNVCPLSSHPVDDDSCRCVCDCVICSLFTDLKPLNESIRKLKAIELSGDPPVETVLSALSGQIEELRLTVEAEVCYPVQCLCTHCELYTCVHMHCVCSNFCAYNFHGFRRLEVI